VVPLSSTFGNIKISIFSSYFSNRKGAFSENIIKFFFCKLFCLLAKN
jgi:hypothetical protein